MPATEPTPSHPNRPRIAYCEHCGQQMRETRPGWVQCGRHCWPDKERKLDPDRP